MNDVTSSSTLAALPADDRPTKNCLRIRFVRQAPAGAAIRRRFQQPQACFAVEERWTLEREPRAPALPEPVDHLDIVFVPPGGEEFQTLAASWLAAPDHPEAAPAIVFERDGIAMHWRPGRALIEAPEDRHAEILAALIEFAFYEGELRALEYLLEMKSAGADGDAAHAHRIRYGDRAHWPRFSELIECFSAIRLKYARLAPRLTKPSRRLPPSARRIMAHLLRRADVDDRLEAFSDRLETCEDLYEGASDRVADYRWYLHGHLIELAIVILLLVEVVLLIIDIWLHFVGE